MKTENKTLSIHFGALADTIGEQLKKQGFDFNEKEVSFFEKQKDAIVTLSFGNILTDSIRDKAYDKLYKKIQAHVIKVNKLKVVK